MPVKFSCAGQTLYFDSLTYTSVLCPFVKSRLRIDRELQVEVLVEVKSVGRFTEKGRTDAYPILKNRAIKVLKYPTNTI